MINCSKKIILASQSPRRAQLLKLVGLDFDVIPSRFDESQITETNPERHVLQSSLAKAQHISDKINDVYIIGSDTIVVLDDKILGKPNDENDAFNMLKSLSGRTHQVFTGFTILEKPGNKHVSKAIMTKVHFKELTDYEIKSYIDTKSPMDKAGSYGIQDLSAVFVDKIEGCFYNVVGFPLSTFYTTLIEFDAKK